MKMITLTKQDNSQVAETPEETVIDKYLKSYSEHIIIFPDQLTTNTLSAFHDCLLLSGCLLSLLSCPDKNKHGKITTYYIGK